MSGSWEYTYVESVRNMLDKRERLIKFLPKATATVAKRNKWRYRQIIAATKAAMDGRSIGWQIAVARRAGYGS